MTNEYTINELMKIAIGDHLQIRQWFYGYNTKFEMSPSEMIQAGRSDEVIAYLVWYIDGPY